MDLIALPKNAKNVAILRSVLDEVLTERFFARRMYSAIEIAEHIVVWVTRGELDIDRLKVLAFRKLETPAKRLHVIMNRRGQAIVWRAIPSEVALFNAFTMPLMIRRSPAGVQGLHANKGTVL
jgi:hypothetical protein